MLLFLSRGVFLSRLEHRLKVVLLFFSKSWCDDLKKIPNFWKSGETNV